jgi:hypothetical protein
LPFKFNLQRYTTEAEAEEVDADGEGDADGTTGTLRALEEEDEEEQEQGSAGGRSASAGKASSPLRGRAARMRAVLNLARAKKFKRILFLEADVVGLYMCTSGIQFTHSWKAPGDPTLAPIK